LCYEEDEPTVYRITEHSPFTIFGVKPKRVVESLRPSVLKEEFPGVAAVGGFVEARLVAGAGGHGDGRVCVEGLDAAKIEFLCTWGHGAGLPDVSAIFGAKDGAIASAGPRDSVADVVNAAEVGAGVGGLQGELCGGGDRDGEQGEEERGAHGR